MFFKLNKWEFIEAGEMRYGGKKTCVKRKKENKGEIVASDSVN